jgi:hypothetical protein
MWKVKVQEHTTQDTHDICFMGLTSVCSRVPNYALCDIPSLAGVFWEEVTVSIRLLKQLVYNNTYAVVSLFRFQALQFMYKSEIFIQFSHYAVD